ncbi:MAG TPA: M4 family metallopeptidase [Jatrophihabitans sp.]|uniref:M4 family metallopeptidase n=1 Tax=Jatrophihabitans sp. TaxID=1932789 RepID=UPI002EFD0719
MLSPAFARRRTATLAAALGMAASAVTGIALTTGPATAAPSPKASPSVLAAQSAASLVASRAAALHASSNDAFIQHSVISTREGLQYVPYDRTYKGLPVVGGDFVVVTDATGQVLSTSVAQAKVINVSTVTTHTAAQAAAAARAHAKYKNLDKVAGTRKVVFALGTPRLAYETVVSSHSGNTASKLHAFTDAHTGALVHSYDEVHEGTGTGKWNGPSPLTIDTSHPTSTTWTMTDPIRSGISCRNFSGGAVLSGSDDVWGNGVGTRIETGCVDALYSVQKQWSMLSSWLGRNGIDGSGAGLPIYVGLNENNAYYYHGTRVEIGRNPSGEWVSSLDIVGHEFGHALDDFTPGGMGSSQVKEFTGDVLGTMTEFYANQSAAYDPPDYTIGEEVNLVGNGPIRNMYNPSLAGHPNCYSSSIPTTATHAAAGPGNHWFYLLAEGTNPANGQPTSTTCNGSTGLVGIGIQTAGKIFYHAMLAKTTNMTYLQYRTATLNAAMNLSPGSCANFNKVKAAWDAVSVPAQTADPTCSANVAVNGGFEDGPSPWTMMPGTGTNYLAYQSGQVWGESARSGQYYAATNAAQDGGGIYQDLPVSTVAGDVYCGSAWVRTQYPETGASGTFVLWLLGGDSTENGNVKFNSLGNGADWRQVQTCVTATTSHHLLRIQFYPDPYNPTLEIDDVDVR